MDAGEDRASNRALNVQNALENEAMTRFPSVAQAEKAAMEGRNASQDSQAILDAMKAEFGVGTVSTQVGGQFCRCDIMDPNGRKVEQFATQKSS